MKAPKFKNRWLVTCKLKTESEMHVGDGGVGELHDRTRLSIKDRGESDASTVCVAGSGAAYIPGAGIKGALRSLVSGNDWDSLFGSKDPQAKDAVGGKLEFWDAFHVSGQGSASEQSGELHGEHDRQRPWWDNERKTCVAVSVSLDRKTRTAKENLLYHLEYVPAHESFQFEISGDNLDDAEIKKILQLLGEFNRGTVTLGAQASNGWGQVHCTVQSLRKLDPVGVELWKKDPVSAGPAMVTKDCESIARAEIDALMEGGLPGGSADWLRVCLKLKTNSPWLIRDPRQRERSIRAKSLELTEEQKPSDAVAIHDEQGHPFVPAKSLRGALRARAEMILRTLGATCADHPGEIPATSTKGKSTDEVLTSIQSKDLAAKLFGLAGWQAPLRISRLVQETSPPMHHQEFVAIDRFTGGAADGAKFDADLAGATTLSGTLVVNLERLRQVDKELACIGLLGLVLRDLAEGDIPLGSGSSRGQGSCNADAEVVDGKKFTSLREWFASDRSRAALSALRSACGVSESSSKLD